MSDETIQFLMSYAQQLIPTISALLGAVVGSAATLLSNLIYKKIQESGRIALYVRIVHSLSGAHRTWGYYLIPGEDTNLTFHIPIWLEITNTCGTTRILRDINLYVYRDGKELASFTQSQHLGNKEKYTLGQNGAYTVVVPEKSSCRFDMEFFVHQDELSKDNQNFDEIVLGYYDEKDRFHKYHVIGVQKCWVCGALERPKVWIPLKNEKKKNAF